MEGQDVVVTAASIGHTRTPNACVRCKSRKIRCDGKVPICNRCLNCGETCRYQERKGRGTGKSKQYIHSLEQRLKAVETTRQASPARDEGENQHSVEPNERGDTQPTADRIHAQHLLSYFERAAFIPLPPGAHIIHFIISAIQDINQMWPLFSLGEVRKLVTEQYAAGLSNCNDNPTRWATLNALLATGFQWNADNEAIGELFTVSWAHFKNAYAIFPELVMQGADVQACQAILAMALFMQGTADARTFTNLLSAAAQASQCFGFHLKYGYGDGELAEAEKRRRTFWLIYVLQSNASIRFGLQAPASPPGSLFHPTNLDDEVGVELPNQEPATDTSNTPSASAGTGLLRHMSTLALIQSRIQRRLCLGSVLWRSHDGMLQALTQLDNELETWKLGLPAELRPTSTPQVVEPGIVLLHFGYYASTWKIHAANNRLQELLAPTPSLLLISLTPADGARATICLLQSLPPQPFAFLCQLICYPVCAVLILLTAVLDDPGGSEAGTNVDWIGQFVRFLLDYQLREGCDVKNLIDGCSKLYDIASSAKDSTEGQGGRVENNTAELWQQYRDLHLRLRGSADLMQVAQGLLTNMPLLYAKANEVFSGIFPVPSTDGFGLLVPEMLKPRSFNFFFGSKQ